MNNKWSLLTGLILALVLAAAAAAQSNQAGTAGAQQTAPAQTAPAQTAPAAEPSSAGSPQQGTGADASQEPPPAPTSPGSRTPAGAPSSPATAGGSTPSSVLAATDKTFIRDAALGNLEGEELGRLAAEKASSPDVKSFGQKMADDHKQANETLKKVASSLQYEPPSRPSSRIKSEKAQLEKLSGADFDREFLKLVVKEHQKDVTVFERESKREAAPAGLKSFAGSTLQGLQEHIRMAQDLSGKLGAGSSSSPGSSSRPQQR